MRPSEEARRYLGKTEILGNKGFTDPEFEAEMREEGWQTGYAWCMILCRVVYVNCYPEKAKELRKLIVPGVLNTFRNLRDAAYPIGNVPQIDSLVIWAQMRDGKQTGFGHAGICTQILNNGFKSIEGNTSSPGVREGWIVAENAHGLNFSAMKGLRLLGFVHIPKPITITLNA